MKACVTKRDTGRGHIKSLKQVTAGHSILLTLVLAAVINSTYCRPTRNIMLNPIIVLVTGAFHVDSVMDVLGAQLQQAGYHTRTKGLVTVNGPGLSVTDDTTALQDLLHPLIVDQGKDIVLYLHSYAGFPGSAAIGGLSKKERSSKGEQGGIVGLVYQSAFIPQQGDTLVKMIGGSYAPWQSPDVRSSSFNDMFDAHVQVGKNWAHQRD